MQHPYQCLKTVRHGEKSFLLAACGARLLVLDAITSKIVSTWTGKEKDTAVEENDSSPEITISDEPAKKKRKPNTQPDALALSEIITTRDGEHVIATTGEDKSVLVLSLDDSGVMSLLSRRRMPKRPCAIAMTPDDLTVLVGDKFGDVYGLPLHPPESDGIPSVAETKEPAKSTARPFKPSATDLTVHTGRNRRALEAQLKQAPNDAQKAPAGLDFAHELLLGHVSMLTSIACVPVQSKLPDKTNTRTYILTADRDEHVRVSRGPPQSYIIDNYCFGHTQFISSLCILPRSANNILVTGGGDDFLLVWDWQNSKQLAKIDLRAALAKYWDQMPVRLRKDKKTQTQTANDEAMLLQDSREAVGKAEQSTNPEELVSEQLDDENDDKIAVAGIWSVPLPEDENVETYVRNEKASIFCTLEGVPAVFHFLLPSYEVKALESTSIDMQVLPLAGNPLDIVVTTDGKQLLVAVDNMHEPGTTNEIRKAGAATPRVQCIDVERRQEVPSESVAALNDHLMNDAEETVGDIKGIRSLLYGVETLRKRGGEEP